MALAEQLLPELEQAMATTRRLLERVPSEKGEWKPHGKSSPLGHLAQLVDVPVPSIHGPIADERW